MLNKVKLMTFRQPLQRPGKCNVIKNMGKRIMKKTKPARRRPALRPIIYSILSALPLLGAHNAAADFPDVPLSLSGSRSEVKPNVLLFLDTSGSMKYDITPKTRYEYNYRTGQYEKVIVQSGERQKVATKAAKDIIRNNPNLRWGLATFHNDPFSYRGREYTAIYGANIRVPIDDINNVKNPGADPHFNKLNTAIDNLVFGGSTPTTSAYYELTRYFRGMEGAYPDMAGRNKRVTHQSPIQYRCQKNFIVFISDGQPAASPWGYSGNYDHTHGSSYTERYNRSSRSTGYPMLVPEGTRPLGAAYDEDGPFGHKATGLRLEDSPSQRTQLTENAFLYECSKTNSCTMYNELGLSHFTRTAHTKDLMPGSKTDKEGKSFDDPEFPKQTIETYTIGFGEDIPTLEHAAKEGGGQYFPVKSAAALNNALNDIFSRIAVAASEFSGSAPAVAADNGKITAAENIGLDTAVWSGDLRFYDVSSDGQILSTYHPPVYKPAEAVTAISTPGGLTNLNPSKESLSRLNNDVFGLDAAAPADQWKKLAGWLSRTTPDAASGYRVREESKRYLGDVFGGGLVAMGIANKQGYTLGDSKREFLAVGSNDGMVHIYRKHGAGAHEYTDVFQYVPGQAKRTSDTDTVNTNLKKTAEANYGGANHVNLVNGEISWFETWAKNGDSRVVLTGGLGEGGRAAYALGVAGTNRAKKGIGLYASNNEWLKGGGAGGGDPDQADQYGVPLWDTSWTVRNHSSEVDKTIGYTFGEPFNGRLSLENNDATKADGYKTTGKIFYATVLSSGFKPPVQSDGKYPAPSVYVLDSLGLEAGNSNSLHTVNKNSAPGKLVKRITTDGLPNIDTASPKGLSAATGLDIDADGVFDVAYAGDQNGNLYRFDMRGKVDEWNAELLFQGNPSQPITAAPTVFRSSKNGKNKVTVLFGTGSELNTADLRDTAQQRFYGIQDPLTDDAAKRDLSAHNSKYPLKPASSELLQRSFSESNKVRTLHKGDAPMGEQHLGWYMNLQSGNGERVVKKPVLGGSRRRGGTVVFSTTVFTPPTVASANSCTPGDTTNTLGFVMTLDAETGGRPMAQRFSKEKYDEIGKLYEGKLSSVLIPNSNETNQSVFGHSKSGKITAFDSGSKDIPNSECGNGVVNSSTKGLQNVNFYCPASEIQRISWREIF